MERPLTKVIQISPYQMETYCNLAGLETIANEWREMLNGRADTAFYHYPEWYAAFLENMYDAPEEVYFCVLRRDGRMLAVAPLRAGRQRVCGVRAKILNFPQDIEHMPVGDFIFAADVPVAEAMEAMLEGLRAIPALSWDAIRLNYVSAGAACRLAFEQFPAIRRLKRIAGYRFVLTIESYESWLAGLSKKTRQNLKQYSNRLKRAGESRSETVMESSRLGAALDILFDLEDSGWKNRSGTSIKRSPRLMAFYHALVERFGQRGECMIHLLYLNEQPIAASLELCCGEVAYMLKLGYDEQHAKLSPGTLLVNDIFRYFSEQTPVRTFNLMSDAKYMSIWNPEREPSYHLSHYKATPLGFAAYGQDWVSPRMAELYRRSVLRAWRGVMRRLPRSLPVTSVKRA